MSEIYTMISSNLSRASKAFTFCGCIVLVNDLLEPLGPMAMLALVISILILCLTFFFSSFLSKWKEEVIVLRLALGLLAIVSMALVYYQSVHPEAAEKGVAASNAPPAAELQAFLGISQTLKDIKNDTAAIVANTASGKKETSNDPQKELSNLGVAWRYESFMEALRTGNARVVGLFLQSGLRPRPEALRIAFLPDYFNPEVARLLSQPGVFDPVAACLMNLDFLSDSLSHPERGPYMRLACGAPSVVDSAVAKRDQAAKALADAQAFNRNRDAIIRKCIVDLKQKLPLDQMLDKASRFNLHSVTTIASPEDRALSRLNQLLLFSAIRNPEKAYAEAVEDACAKANSPRAENNQTLQQWQGIVDSLTN